MNLTIAEIATHRSRLRQEIMERECLLAAFDVVEKYAASGHAPSSLQLGNFVSGFLSARPAVELQEPAPPAPVEPSSQVPSTPLPPPEVESYVHPELKDARSWSEASLVRWAIKRMTSDFSAHDLAAMLGSEGRGLAGSSISTVLTRLKRRREIEELKPGAGPNPAIIRNPNPPADSPTISTGEAEAGKASVVLMAPEPVEGRADAIGSHSFAVG